ncbi:MAG: antibiotic biosynthesis monooxygenase [Ectobacillus sp.]
MFIAVNTIEVQDPERMKEMFRKAAPHLNHFEGFLGFELWETEGKILAVARWESKEHFDKYLASDMFKQQHGGASGEQMRPKAQVSLYTAEKMA